VDLATNLYRATESSRGLSVFGYCVKGDCTDMTRKKKVAKQPTKHVSAPKKHPKTIAKGPHSSTVAAPVAIGRSMSAQKPVTKQLPGGDIRVVHREYFTDMLGAVAFTVGSTTSGTFPAGLLINPGNATMFPWLSKLAYNFESYIFEHLEFIYVSQTSTAQSGRVILAIDYDAADPAPLDKRSALANRASVASFVWGEARLPTYKEDIQKRKTYFVDTQQAPVNGSEKDLSLSCTGTFQPAVMGATAALNLGELYVSYTVKLMTPHYNAISFGDCYETSTSTVNLIAGNLIGTNRTKLSYTSAQNAVAFSTVAGAGAGIITFNVPGMYLFTIAINGTTLALPFIDTYTGGALTNVATATTNAGDTINGAVNNVVAWRIINVRTIPATYSPTVTSAVAVSATYFNIGVIGNAQPT